jgi:hypothetical protein
MVIRLALTASVVLLINFGKSNFGIFMRKMINRNALLFVEFTLLYILYPNFLL